MKKRLLILLFVILGLFPLFVSCSEGGDSGSPENNVEAEGSRKIIYEVFYEIESRDVNQIEDAITIKVRDFNGYISNSVDNKDQSRYSYKIPTEKLNEFLDYVDSFGDKVKDKTIESTDVTTQYSKLEERIKVLEASKTAYLNLLTDGNLMMPEIIEIKEKIEDIDTELLGLYNKLASYDSVIDYTTITINYVDDPRFFATYGNYLVKTFEVIYQVILYMLPYGLVVAIIIFLANLPGYLKKRRRNKNQNQN